MHFQVCIVQYVKCAITFSDNSERGISDSNSASWSFVDRLRNWIINNGHIFNVVDSLRCCIEIHHYNRMIAAFCTLLHLYSMITAPIDHWWFISSISHETSLFTGYTFCSQPEPMIALRLRSASERTRLSIIKSASGWFSGSKRRLNSSTLSLIELARTKLLDFLSLGYERSAQQLMTPTMHGLAFWPLQFDRELSRSASRSIRWSAYYCLLFLTNHIVDYIYIYKQFTATGFVSGCGSSARRIKPKKR